MRLDKVPVINLSIRSTHECLCNVLNIFHVFRYGGGYQLGQLMSEVAGGFNTHDMLKEVSGFYLVISFVN